MLPTNNRRPTKCRRRSSTQSSLLARLPRQLRECVLNFAPTHRDRFAPSMRIIRELYGQCHECGTFTTIDATDVVGQCPLSISTPGVLCCSSCMHECSCGESLRCEPWKFPQRVADHADARDHYVRGEWYDDYRCLQCCKRCVICNELLVYDARGVYDAKDHIGDPWGVGDAAYIHNPNSDSGISAVHRSCSEECYSCYERFPIADKEQPGQTRYTCTNTLKSYDCVNHCDMPICAECKAHGEPCSHCGEKLSGPDRDNAV